MVSNTKNVRVIYEVEIYKEIGNCDYDLIFRDFYRNKKDAFKDIKTVCKGRDDVEYYIHPVHPRYWHMI